MTKHTSPLERTSWSQNYIAGREDKKRVDTDDFDAALDKIRLGPVHYGDRNGHPFLGKELSDMKSYSEATGMRIDKEIQKTLLDLEKKAEEILTRHRDQLDDLARELMTHETLEDEDIDRIIGNKIP